MLMLVSNNKFYYHLLGTFDVFIQKKKKNTKQDSNRCLHMHSVKYVESHMQRRNSHTYRHTFITLNVFQTKLCKTLVSLI